MLVIGFLVVLGPLVFFHELGHFFVAKWAGIRVLEFGFGFPPRMFKFWQGKGRLSVGSTRVTIPSNFKGLPASAAEYRQFEQEPKSQALASDENQAIDRGSQRVPDILDVGDYVEILTEKLAHGTYVLRKLTRLDPERDDVSPLRQQTPEGVCMRGELTEYVPGTIYSVNWLLPVGGFVRMLGEEDPSAPDSFAAAPKRRRAAVLLAGSFMNIMLALVVFTVAWMSGVQEPTACRIEVTQIVSGTPAETAGLQPQDIILMADDKPMDVCYGLNEYVREHTGQQIVLKIERAGQVVQVPITPRVPGQYDSSREGPLGISIMHHVTGWTIHRASLPEALSNALVVIGTVITGIMSLPVMLLSGAAMSLLGPIGISQAGGEAIEMSRASGTLFPLLVLIGQVSVAVGLTNILPLPAMDGGRLLFVLFEWIRGRRIDPRKEMVIHLVGLGLLLVIAAMVSYGDIVRLIRGQRLF